MSNIISLDDAAQMLQCSTRTIQRYIAHHLIRSFKFGRRLGVDRADVEALYAHVRNGGDVWEAPKVAAVATGAAASTRSEMREGTLLRIVQISPSDEVQARRGSNGASRGTTKLRGRQPKDF